MNQPNRVNSPYRPIFSDAEKKQLPPLQLIPVPDHVDVIETDEGLDIRYSHFANTSKFLIVFLTFFNLVWNGIVGFFAWQMLTSGNYGSLIFLSFHILAGIIMFGWLASVYLNHTDIILDHEGIHAHVEPISMKGTTFIPRHEIRQLFVQKVLSSTSNGQPNYIYKVWALSHDHKKVLLVKAPNPDLAVYLEASLEQRLHLPDEPVAGEYKP